LDDTENFDRKLKHDFYTLDTLPVTQGKMPKHRGKKGKMMTGIWLTILLLLKYNKCYWSLIHTMEM